MAANGYRPDCDYLKSIGFVEINTGKEHPYEREYSLDLGKNTYLICDSFWDFRLEINGNWNIGITFFDNNDLNDFINRVITKH